MLHFYQSQGLLGILAEQDSVVGFALGNIEPFYTGSLFYCRGMCVDSSLHRKGIGSEIIETLNTELAQRNVKKIYLATGNAIPAASFYQSKGFELSNGLGFYARNISE